MKHGHKSTVTSSTARGQEENVQSSDRSPRHPTSNSTSSNESHNSRNFWNGWSCILNTAQTREVLFVGAVMFLCLQRSLLSVFLDDDSSSLAHEEEEVLLRKKSQYEPMNPLTCWFDVSGHEKCCASWLVSVDEWWLHHPEWEITEENDYYYCMRPIAYPDKAKYFREVYDSQWFQPNCSAVETSDQINSGFGASFRHLMHAWWHARKAGVPFQIEENNRRWLYSTANESSWAYCPSEDISCYYLPISPCPRNASQPGLHLSSRPNKTDTSEMKLFFWLEEYFKRPKHNYRRQLFEMRQKLNVSYPCTTMHVRRGDSGTPRVPFRRYAAVQEYIDKASIPKGGNIVLLTDDETTIEEVQKYHKDDYNWIYLDRPRNRGTSGGFDGHIPSGDEGFEMVAMEIELYYGSTCQSIVCGKSAFMDSLVRSMEAFGREYSLYYVDTRVSKEEAQKFGAGRDIREESMFEAIEAINRQSSVTQKDISDINLQ